ncbi:hypothetical protein GSbR_15090 [Geobacter sp. SVR]|nr:hypothetical protein GSVR_00300 [Geobacter sp. SVR]GCF84909.1 hypothetical protein GSbR_15090 [Geobacter sp. SVR]
MAGAAAGFSTAAVTLAGAVLEAAATGVCSTCAGVADGFFSVLAAAADFPDDILAMALSMRAKYCSVLRLSSWVAQPPTSGRQQQTTSRLKSDRFIGDSFLFGIHM